MSYLLPVHYATPSMPPKILSMEEEENLEKEITHLRMQKELVLESQAVYERTIGRRRCTTKICSCVTCPCTCPILTAGFIVCYPVICYGLLQKNTDYFAKVMQCMGCLQGRPPNNRWELFCTYCTPYFLDAPDSKDYYTLRHERTDEALRMEKIQEVEQGIKMRNQHITWSHLQSPSREQLLLNPASPSQEELGIHASLSLDELIPKPSTVQKNKTQPYSTIQENLS